MLGHVRSTPLIHQGRLRGHTRASLSIHRMCPTGTGSSSITRLQKDFEHITVTSKFLLLSVNEAQSINSPVTYDPK